MYIEIKTNKHWPLVALMLITFPRTGEQGDFVEGGLQLPHQDVHEAVFGEVRRLLGALVINHHFLLPAQLHLQNR